MNKNYVSEEFRKVKSGFNKVKEDMNELLNYINKLQKSNNEQNQMIFDLKDEIDKLKETIKFKNNHDCPQQKIVANIESKKFHYDNCPYAKNIKEDNKVEFESIEKAIKSGYKECSCIRE